MGYSKTFFIPEAKGLKLESLPSVHIRQSGVDQHIQYAVKRPVAVTGDEVIPQGLVLGLYAVVNDKRQHLPLLSENIGPSLSRHNAEV